MSACHGVALIDMILYGQTFFFRMRERVDLSSAMKVNFIVKQHECGVCFSIMHLLQQAVYKTSVATQFVSYRF
jgi:hypothetical protein